MTAGSENSQPISSGGTPILGADVAIELRQETRDALLAAYVGALMLAQATHDPWAWMAAGSFFKRYAEAAIAAETDDLHA